MIAALVSRRETDMTTSNRYRLVLAVAAGLHALSHLLHRRNEKSLLSRWACAMGDAVAWVAHH